MALKPRLPPQL